MTYYGDNAPELAASVIALTVIAFILFGLRVYTRLHNNAWGLDDWSMTAAIVSKTPTPFPRTAQLTMMM